MNGSYVKQALFDDYIACMTHKRNMKMILLFHFFFHFRFFVIIVGEIVCFNSETAAD